MAQITKSLAQAILNGSGYTDNEVKQLAYACLKNNDAQQTAEDAPNCGGCSIEIMSDVICDRGTNGCVLKHDTFAQQSEAPVNVPADWKKAYRDWCKRPLPEGFDLNDIPAGMWAGFHGGFHAALAAAPAPVQTEAQQSEKDALDAKRYRYITEVVGMRFKPAGRLCLDTLEDTNVAIDAAIAKEKANQKGGA